MCGDSGAHDTFRKARGRLNFVFHFHFHGCIPVDQVGQMIEIQYHAKKAANKFAAFWNIMFKTNF
jgi:fructose-1,6-bisphosphatase